MKYTKRILSFALVLVMVFALCAPTLADAQKKYEPYKVYTCLGDSVAAGSSALDKTFLLLGTVTVDLVMTSLEPFI